MFCNDHETTPMYQSGKGFGCYKKACSSVDNLVYTHSCTCTRTQAHEYLWTHTAHERMQKYMRVHARTQGKYVYRPPTYFPLLSRACHALDCDLRMLCRLTLNFPSALLLLQVIPPHCPHLKSSSFQKAIMFEGEFSCLNGQCVAENLRCDGEHDCDDQSDEVNCSECSEDAYLCGDKHCIPKENVCDGVTDCDTDELECCEGSGSFECESDGTCLGSDKMCNGIKDCPNGEDEKGCPGEMCQPGEYRCKNGDCIPISQRCDGLAQCRDQSDESGCPCGNGEWTCEDRTCIPQQARCDGRYDCPDYTDENGCQSGCSPGEWTCRNGDCIPDYQRCDRTPQCLDRSDEENCRPEPACGSEEWTCRIGTCIPVQAVCDGRYDCPDYTDEEGCPVDKSCSPSEWTCRNGDCIPDYQRCDRTPQCLDRSDEENCRPEPGLFSLHCVLEIILGVWMLSFVEDYVTSYRVIKRVWDQYNK
nr:low-density lipoprotein receptor-related protein 8-like [Penaeus vannamei]